MTYLIITFVGRVTTVSGQSMEPSLHNGNRLIIDKLSYRFREPERYDIVVFPYKHEKNTYYIKRIIGMPGESVLIASDGEVYIDGEALGETYGREAIQNPGIAQNPVLLGEDEYFVLGDNRNHSMDSRDSRVGVLEREDLVGRAWVRIWPLSEFGGIRHE